MRATSLLLAFALATTACQTATSHVGEAPYTLVFLKTGPATGLSKEKQQEVFAGHFANMERLAREGHLVLAGPFGKVKTDPSLRGIFVLATGDEAKARALAETDPGVVAGVFVLEYHAIATSAALPKWVAGEMARDDALKAEGKTPKPGEFGRGFVLLIGEDGARVRGELAERKDVLLLASYDGTGALAVLDAADCGEASKKFEPVLQKVGAHRLEDWFASRGLEQLPDMQ